MSLIFFDDYGQTLYLMFSLFCFWLVYFPQLFSLSVTENLPCIGFKTRDVFYILTSSTRCWLLEPMPPLLTPTSRPALCSRRRHLSSRCSNHELQLPTTNSFCTSSPSLSCARLPCAAAWVFNMFLYSLSLINNPHHHVRRLRKPGG